MKSKMYYLIGFTRPIPDVCTFVTPIFYTHSSSSYWIQEYNNEAVTGFVEVFISGEEFIPNFLSPALFVSKVGCLAYHAYETQLNQIFAGNYIQMKDRLKKLLTEEPFCISDIAKRTIERFINNSVRFINPIPFIS